jgi:hypothetical protein
LHPEGKGEDMGRILVVAVALVVSLFVLFLEGGAPAQAIVGGTEVKPVGKHPFMVALLANWDPTKKSHRNISFAAAR